MTEGCSVWIMAEMPSSTAVTLSDALTTIPAMAIITIIPAIIFDAASQNKKVWNVLVRGPFGAHHLTLGGG